MACLGACSVNGQTKIDSMLIINTGVYQATVVDANKIQSEPVVVDSTKKIQVKGYNINSKKINTGFDVEPIAAAQMMGEPLTKLYNGLVKLGFGNYTTPYAELWYNNLRSKEYAYGLRLKHLSSTCTLEDYGNSSYSDNEISLYGKKFLKEHTLTGNFDYARNVVHFYGYDLNVADLDKDMTVQRFNYFGANAELRSHYSNLERYNHDVRLSYYNLADLYQSSENNIKLDGFVQKAINKELLKVGAGVDYYNDKTSKDTVNNTILNLSPDFIASGQKYKATIGFKVNLDMGDATKFYFYPHVEFSYNIFEDIIVPYVVADGGVQKNSLKSITDDNPFVLSGLNLKNTNEKFKIQGGLKGTLSSTISYNVAAAYSSLSNLAMYENDRTEFLKNRFNVIYDNAELLNVSAQVTYQDREKLRVLLRGDYYNYTMDTEVRAWYKPQLKISLGANYDLKDKLIVKADIFYLDDQYAKTYVADASQPTGEKLVAEKLKGIVDANIGFEYRYNKKLGFFLNFNNIASTRYYRYLNYPTQKFCLMGGLSYSF